MKKNQITFIERHIRGAIGKRFVIKHYKGGKVVKTKYPDMSNIVRSSRQKVCMQRFKEAAAYAQAIMKDETQRKEWEKRTRLYKNDLRNKLISRHMTAAKEKELKAQIASGKCISYQQVQVLSYQGQPLNKTLRSLPKKRSSKRKPLSKSGMENLGKPPRKTKRKIWIKTTKDNITINIQKIKIPVLKKSIYQFVLGFISLIPIFGGKA